MNKNIVVVIALAIVGGAAGYFVGTQEREAAVDSNDPAIQPSLANEVSAIDFSLNDIDGNLRQLSEWHGKGRLVNFWATWCAPCRREIPLLKQTQELQAGNNVQIIGIAVDFQEDVESYAEEVQFNYPILVGQEDAMAAAEVSGVEFLGLPFTLIVSPEGELLKTHVGEIVEAHIDLIVDVFARLETGTLDTSGAKAALDAL